MSASFGPMFAPLLFATGFTSSFAYQLNTADRLTRTHFVARETTLTDVYFWVTGSSVPASNVTLKVDIVETNAGTSVGSTTCGVNGAFTWSRATFGTPPTLVVGRRYTVTVSNVSATPATDNATVQAYGGYNVPGFAGIAWSGTANVGGGSGAPLVLKYGSGLIVGTPFTNSTNPTGATYRGLYLPALGTSMVLSRVILASALTPTLTIYKATSLPGATPGTGELYIDESGNGGTEFITNFTLDAGTAYRICTTAANATPAKLYINDSARYADVLAAVPMDGACWTQSNGTTGWTDDTTALPSFQLEFSQIIDPAGGGGTSGPIGGGNLNGGLQ